jgi:hypothetical protein
MCEQIKEDSGTVKCESLIIYMENRKREKIPVLAYFSHHRRPRNPTERYDGRQNFKFMGGEEIQVSNETHIVYRHGVPVRLFRSTSPYIHIRNRHQHFTNSMLKLRHTSLWMPEKLKMAINAIRIHRSHLSSCTYGM